MRFEGKNGLITGGAGIIGKAAARKLLQEGANVVLVDLDSAALEKAARELGSSRIATLVADVTREEDAAGYAENAVSAFGPVDIFFNNAGIEGPLAPMHAFPLAAFEEVFAVNVTGVFLGLKHVLPLMREGGSVIITSSTAGLRGTPNFAAYTASKHAVVGLMRTAAAESAPRRIRVNTIHPAMVESDMMARISARRAAGDSGLTPEQVRANYTSKIPLGRYIDPEEVAGMVCFLASDEAAMLTGSQYLIDGGAML